MSVIQWIASTRSGNPITVLSTELNSIATTGSAITGTAIDNDADLDIYMDLELYISYASAPTSGAAIDCYLVRTVDGTNFEDASTSGPVIPASGNVGAFILRNVTGAQRMVLPGVIVPPRDFHVMLVCRTTGQTAAASGNTLKAFFYREQVV